MAIKLRTNQPTALTYREMDRNFSSFFYSASVNPDTAILTLWYTGSQDLNDLSGGETYDPGRSVEINLQATSSGTVVAAVAGNNREVQFNDNGQFGASTNLIYTPIGHLGVGTNIPLQRLHVKGSSNYPAMLRLESISGTNQRANVEFYHVNTFYGSVGRDKTNDTNLYIKTFIPSTGGGSPGHLRFNIGSNTEAGAWTQVGLGVGTLAPQYQFHTEGTGYFSTGVSIGVQDTSEKLVVNGNMSTAIAAGKIGFVVSDAYNDDNYPHYGLGKKDGQELVNLSGYFGLSFGTVGSERMRIDTNGNIGIGTQTIAEKLTVQGNISGSGNIKVNGTATVATLSPGSALTTSAVVATSAGLLQKIDAAPIPKGGIIMWSGDISAIPAGWRLCDGGTINGMTTPNLQDKFIVGAGSTYAVATTGGSADAIIVAHTHTATSIDSGHTHNWGYGTEQDDSGTGGSNREFTKTAATNSPAVPSPILASSANITTTVNSAGESGTNKNLPPYYALAYIMYGGI